MLKALSHSLQVEFTYIKSGKQVRFMADSDIKASPLALSLSPPPPHHTRLCLFLVAHVWQQSWMENYCSINHVPFFSVTHSTRRLSETEATFCQPLWEEYEGDKYSSEQTQSLVELHLLWYLNLFQIMFSLLESSLADTVLTIYCHVPGARYVSCVQVGG